jgi:chorismate synthase
VCAVSAASVIVENVVAFEVAAALVDKFGGDSVAEMKARYDLFLKMARER